MYITLVVLMGGAMEEPEAGEFDLNPGMARSARLVEEGLERLLAPHDASTELVVRNVRDDLWEKRVPNYGASFDFWGLDEAMLEHFWDRFVFLTVERKIYADLWDGVYDENAEEDGAPKGHPVFRASELPTDLPYGAVVTPDGLYHELWTGENRDNRPGLAEKLIKEHGGCLAVLCSAHV